MAIGVPDSTTVEGGPETGPKRTARKLTWEDRLDAAAIAGISEDEFWNLTPREFDRVTWAYNERIERSQKQDVVLAWFITSLRRQKRIPSLAVLLNPPQAIVGELKKLKDAEHEDLMKRLNGGV